ncbi:MAG: amidohydrolase family protein, partial [Phycisphaerae bacterium]|nr:amidohydrolase family protein [Phycisphaerae bacterium]
RFFQHEPHPFERMLARGINVCLGTDSLASTDSPSILDEMRFLRAHHAGISNAAILEMATIRGARALGLETQIGSLDVGKRADFCVIPLQDSSAADPLNDLLASPLPPTAVYMAGRQVVAAD